MMGQHVETRQCARRAVGDQLQSQGFDSPKAAAQTMARIREQGMDCLAELSDQLSFQAAKDALQPALASLLAKA